MAIYSLQDKKTSALLIGGSKSTAEMAIRLRDKSIPFTIYIPFDDPSLFSIGDSPIIPVHMIPLTEHITFRAQDITSIHDFIIDCQAITADHKASLILEVSEEFPQAIILSSSLACTATEIMSYFQDSRQVIGFAFLPSHSGEATVMEIAKALNASEQSLDAVKMFFASADYTCEVVEDRVGMVLPRVLATLINEAAFAFLEKIATAQDIDIAMKQGVNYPKGLLEWADLIGLDTVLAILDSLYSEYRQERYRPCIILRQYCRAKWIGKSAGKGFYSYASGYK